MKKLLSIFVFAFLYAHIVCAQTGNTNSTTGERNIKIRITVGNRAVTATMLDNITAREFAALLPFTMTLNDFAAREKYGHCARPLSETVAGRQKPYKVGDIGYWSPNSDFAIFYRHDGSEIPDPGITMIGTVDNNGIEVFNVSGRVTATFEVIK
jgi:hypothetical protein